MRAWLLPEYIEDILPAEAHRIERLRRGILDLFAVHGYRLVMPPLLEYVDSLLTGTGHDLDLQTFKLVDQISGRMLGVRADITPQVARIDAHLLNRSGVTRLCYAGSVLRTLPSGLNRTREPLQVGAEIYGHRGIESDVEIQRLMMRGLGIAGVSNAYLDLGHVAVFRSLIKRAAGAAELESELFRAMQAKDVPAVSSLSHRLERGTREALTVLPELYGGVEVLRLARRKLPAYPEIKAALRALEALSERLRDVARIRCFDLAELRGYHYHSGVVFAAYADGWPNALALGGRYDEVGKAFGRARPATGFSMDLRELASASPEGRIGAGILAPYRPRNAGLQRRIDTLRARGEIVIEDLPGHVDSRAELGCNRRLVRRAGKWVIEKLK
ncbi:MAG: ATP phosphoribosyltransferase regulatory subunit [Betaproteobacteria bacterium RIFCSPLOWO2_12_FULL_62_13]|nr:MAG: ATP phosphoribosyltransferase regulatory subunit [Betaproteobacteria bacterium RIFCSPLOWO2_12_FULL_62_13]